MFFPKVAFIDLNSGDNPTVTVTIAASSGSFATISGSGLTVNQSGDTVTITGDLADINNALASGLTYTPVGTLEYADAERHRRIWRYRIPDDRHQYQRAIADDDQHQCERGDH